MTRWIPVLALLVVLAGGGATPSTLAQDASPVATPAGDAAPLDLPATVLYPEDLDVPGFGTGRAAFQSAEAQAEFFAMESGLSGRDILADLHEAGIGRRYNLALEQPMTEGMATPGVDLDLVGKRIETSITEYASAEGAAAGFDLIDRQIEDLMDAEDVPLTTPFGDESELTRKSRITPDTNTPYQELNITFRKGNLVADVVFQNLRNEEIDPAEVEALAQKLSDRIDAVQAHGSSALSNLIVRTEGDAAVDAYVARDGTAIPAFGEPAAGFAARDSAYSGAGVVHAYVLEQSLGEFPYLTARLYQFSSPEAASAWLAEQPAATLTAPDSPYIDVGEVTEVDPVGEESRVFTYGLEVAEGTTVYGHAIFFRGGQYVARIEVDSVPEAPLAAALELAQAQARCLQAGICLEPAAIPLSLADTDSPPLATLEATPAA